MVFLLKEKVKRNIKVEHENGQNSLELSSVNLFILSSVFHLVPASFTSVSQCIFFAPEIEGCIYCTSGDDIFVMKLCFLLLLMWQSELTLELSKSILLIIRLIQLIFRYLISLYYLNNLSVL